MILKRKYFKKLVITYIIITFVYSLLTVGMFFFKNYQSFNNEKDNAEDLLLMQLKEKTDSKIESAYNVSKKVLINDSIYNYASNDEIDYHNITMVFNELSTLTNFDFMLSVNNMKNDILVTPQGTIKTSLFYNKIGVSPEIGALIDTYWKAQRNENPFLIIPISETPNSEGENFLTIINKEMMRYNQKLLVYYSFNVKDLVKNEKWSNGTGFSIKNGDNMICVQSNDENIKKIKKLDEKIISQLQSSNKSEIKINKTLYKINSIKSDLYPWEYVRIEATKNVAVQVLEIVWGALQVGLILAIFSLLCIYFISKKVYKPIGNLIEKFQFENKDIDDEFLLIEDAITEVKDKYERLRKVINSNKKYDVTNSLRSLLKGFDAETLEVLNQQGFHSNDQKFMVILVDFTNLFEIEKQFSSNEIREIFHNISILIKEKIIKEKLCTICEICEIDQNKVCFIINEADSDMLKKLLNNVFATVEMEFNISLFAAFSENSGTIRELPELYKETIQLLDYKWGIGKQTVITKYDMRFYDNKIFYTIDTERELIFKSIRGSFDECMSILDHVLKENLVIRNIKGETRSMFIFSIASTINRVLQLSNVDATKIFQDGTVFYLELKLCENNNELELLIKTIFTKIINYINSDKGDYDSIISEKMLDFIHSNYNKDISLLDFAENLNFSAKYISTLFKKITGENFKDYLNIYRVKMAKEVLDKKPNIKIKDLATMMGCNSVGTFIRIFKKYEGYSPGQYNEINENK